MEVANAASERKICETAGGFSCQLWLSTASGAASSGPSICKESADGSIRERIEAWISAEKKRLETGRNRSSDKNPTAVSILIAQ
jgi:hypothetical protein